MLVLDTEQSTAVWQVEFSPDASLLVASSAIEPRVSVVATGRRSKDIILTKFAFCTHPHFHPDGWWLFGPGDGGGARSGRPLIYDIRTQKKWSEQTSDAPVIRRAAFTLDGKAVIYTSSRRSRGGQLERRAWEPDGTLGPGWAVPLDRNRGGTSGLAVLSDGERFATTYLHPTNGGCVALWSLATGAVLAEAFFPATTPPALAVAPDGSLVVAQVKHVLRVWPVTEVGKVQGREVKNRGRHHFTGIVFHPSGQYLAATSNDATVKLYDTTTWDVARTFTWDLGRMQSIAFSPDGALAAAGSDTGKVVVWDVDL